MPTTRTYTRAFSGGEVSSEVYGHFDLEHLLQSLATMRNCIALPHGPATGRSGTEFVKEVQDSTKKTRLIPFAYNGVQTFAVELGAGWIRFHTLGGTLLAGTLPGWSNVTSYTPGASVLLGTRNYYCTVANANLRPDTNPDHWYLMPADGTYEIPNSYAEADLFSIHYTQSADVITLTHQQYKAAELKRLGAAQWTLTDCSFAPTLAAPTGVSATVSGPGGGSPVTQTYYATSVDDVGNESMTATSVTASVDLSVAGNIVTLAATPNGTRTRWYRSVYGIAGFIGDAAAGSSFVDKNITPDTSITPPAIDSPALNTFDLNLGATYPGAVGYFEQRRWFAGWGWGPQSVLATRTGTEYDITYHVPTRADDRVYFRAAAREGSQILHVVPSQNLILLTSSDALRVTSTDGGALTATTVSIRPQSTMGANSVQPVTVGTTVIYAGAAGGRLWELAYSTTAQGSFYQSSDLCLLAPHLFDYKTVVDMAVARAPFVIVWVVNDEGMLLGLTYDAGQQVAGWHRHDTDGLFESCCVVRELDPDSGQLEDVLYVMVKRRIGGQTKRYVERMHTRYAPTLADCYVVDCGVSYSGTAISTITDGLDHLNGKVVSILGDGAVMPQQTVVDGGLPAPLQAACAKVQVGLPITQDLVTLPMALATPDFGQGRPKNVSNVWLRVQASSGIQVGPSFDRLVAFKQRTTEPYGTPPARVTGQVEVRPLGSWTNDAQVYVRQTDPLPLTVVSMTLEVSIGG